MEAAKVFSLEIERQRKRKTKFECLVCFWEVEQLLTEGAPVTEVVSFIQDQRDEYREISAKSLRVTIHRWLRNTSEGKKVDKERSKHRLPSRHVDLAKTVEADGIAPGSALNMLFAINFDRMMMIYEKEKQTEHPTKIGSDLIKQLMKITVEQHKIDMDWLDQHRKDNKIVGFFAGHERQLQEYNGRRFEKNHAESVGKVVKRVMKEIVEEARQNRRPESVTVKV